MKMSMNLFNLSLNFISNIEINFSFNHTFLFNARISKKGTNKFIKAQVHSLWISCIVLIGLWLHYIYMYSKLVIVHIFQWNWTSIKYILLCWINIDYPFLLTCLVQFDQKISILFEIWPFFLLLLFYILLYLRRHYRYCPKI